MTPATIDEPTSPSARAGGFRHAALFYSGADEFLARLVPFLRAGIAAGEPALVVVSRSKIDALRRELGPDADGVEFADIADVGANPALIIPAWHEFVETHEGEPVRGIGEPISPARGPSELAECQHHERLLNPALAESQLFLICPYDVGVLRPTVIREACRSHPVVHYGDVERPSDEYDTAVAALGLSSEPLPEPAETAETLSFTHETLARARDAVRRAAERAGVDASRAADLVLASSEIGSNSIRHGGGAGTMRLWRAGDHFICEIRDGGRIHDPLVDRRRPRPDQLGGWGLWLANQCCDLVQLRSLPQGAVARLHMRLA